MFPSFLPPKTNPQKKSAQRELHRQREMVANLRAENATLRNKYQVDVVKFRCC